MNTPSLTEPEALERLAALAQPSRLQAFRLLVEAGADGLPAGQVAERLGARQNTMSGHLAHLAAAGLVRSERDGRIVRYRADTDAIQALLLFLLQDCCGGDAGICTPFAVRVLMRAGFELPGGAR